MANLIRILLLVGIVYATCQAEAGWIEEHDGVTTIHVVHYGLPREEPRWIGEKADLAVLQEFISRFPEIFAERHRQRYMANPDKYGGHAWDEGRVQLHSFSTQQPHPDDPKAAQLNVLDTRIRSNSKLSIAEIDLITAASGLGPDICYVNFHNIADYVRYGLLYPLDTSGDSYIPAIPTTEMERRVHPQVLEVIRRSRNGRPAQIWALPFGGTLGKVIAYRPDVLTAAGVELPTTDWSWDDLLGACRKVSERSTERNGIVLGSGQNESWYWMTYLYGAGGDFLKSGTTGVQQAAFASESGITALDFYLRLTGEAWTMTDGTVRHGYAEYPKPPTHLNEMSGDPLDEGRVAFAEHYISNKILDRKAGTRKHLLIPVPYGPTGTDGKRHRGAELNSRLHGISSAVANPAVRDAAWEYIRFVESPEALAVYAKTFVDAGAGRQLHPDLLTMAGYPDIAAQIAPDAISASDTALDYGRHEPAGTNAQWYYAAATTALIVAREQLGNAEAAVSEEVRRKILQDALDAAAQRIDALISKPREKP